MKQFYITGIRLDSKKEHIEYVRARVHGSNDKYIVPRGFVVDLIGAGVPFKTRYYDGKDWVTGADIEIYDDVYLKSNPNEKAKDNLKNLQKF
ncbi:DUF3892 domain-containing protein [Pseudomonas gingeri]|uniref:DUF3892 domain-containing protein n=1 Tax=Pseudomonas gingeri TaxID=117681 RepID=UPI00159FC8DC|nr:DUF3892 domain-containing protein [Pseudomonas gingeri]NWD04066.1 DUF3892 domain-containing protein [Pseudomonas gingeri]NWE33864.1 DUF3892 domain-containing protein [Pseudomonas gingeri]NWE58050.1 DUF3892 domain-containing protein [Pseudomonas gingeri]NWF04409.1 DUF3892 domain-containing protein [Pseudomonas gingeri]